MKAKFSFFKAGQGSFYGGRIWHHETEKVFTVVYDCGTSPFIKGNSQSLNNEINTFKHSSRYCPHSNDIDLLFISHLDYDHVSGLKRLLKEFNVKNIVLPYIEKQYRQFFLVSFTDDIDSGNNLSIEDYISFIESPNTFIQSNSKETKMYFIKSNDETEIEYQGYDNDNPPENIYPVGTETETKPEELDDQQLDAQQKEKVLVYDNNLQFFIQRKWEFTTYVKSVSKVAITNLHNCLKKKLKKKSTENLTFDDLKTLVLVINNRQEAHKCYKTCIGEINSHGLVLLHGPIHFEHICGRIYSNNELHPFCEDHYHRHFHYDYHFRNNNPIMLGTLLFGDTSLKGKNKIDFPLAFKNKLVNVHVVQIPHHGSSKNWDFNEFKKLKIGDSFNRWENKVITVCNFGDGNRYGHPSHEVLNDPRSTIFLNTQFSRLNIKYNIIHWKP